MEKIKRKNHNNIELDFDFDGNSNKELNKNNNLSEVDKLKSETINLNKSEFDFRENVSSPAVETLKEAIAPSSFDRGGVDYLIVGNKYARTFYIEGFPDLVEIGYLTSLYDGDYDIDVNMRIEPKNVADARAEIQNKLTIVKAQYLDEVERGAHVKRDIFEDQIQKMEAQLAELVNKTQSPYEVQFFFTLYADSKNELERVSSTLIQDLKNNDLTAQIFALRQDKAWKTVVPYGIDYVNDKKRNFNTGSVLSSIPFYIPELYDNEGVYLGTNIFSYSPALLDLYKKGIRNSNLNIFGSSGSGKSTFVKVLTTRSALHGIRTVVIDPEGEYGLLARKMNGANVKLTNDKNHSVMMNIFDIEEEEDLDANGQKITTLNLKQKYEDILGFVMMAVPGMTDAQKSDVLSLVEELYRNFKFKDGDPKSLYLNDDHIVVKGRIVNSSYKRKMPKLSDFLDLMNQLILDGTYPDLLNVYKSLTPYYANKTRGLFDTYTPDELKKLNDLPIINFDISSLESSDTRNLAMYVLLSWVWEKFGKKNPKIKKRIVVDEAWMMMSPNFAGYEHSSTFLENMSRRIRKRNGALCIASQKIEDFSSTTKGSAIISNAYTTILLSHEQQDRSVLQKIFDLDDGVVDHVIDSEVGKILIKQAQQYHLVKVQLFDYEQKVIS